MSIDQIISLATSIGACLSAIAAFLAVKQVSKQRESSYKPEFVLARTSFGGLSNPISKGEIPDTWLIRKDLEEEGNYRQPFSMPLRNVGLGAAKSVKVSWCFPIEDIVSNVNELAQKSLIPAYFEYENGMLSLKSDELGPFISMWGNQKKKNIDFVLPAQIDSSPVELELPHAYIKIVSALVYFSAKSENFRSFPEIPRLNISMEFSDIGGSKHSAQFSIVTHLVSLTNKGETFAGYVESERLA